MVRESEFCVRFEKKYLYLSRWPSYQPYLRFVEIGIICRTWSALTLESVLVTMVLHADRFSQPSEFYAFRTIAAVATHKIG